MDVTIISVVGEDVGCKVVGEVGVYAGIAVAVISGGVIVAVMVGVGEGVFVEGTSVAAGRNDCGSPLHRSSRNSSNKRMATINLKKS